MEEDNLGGKIESILDDKNLYNSDEVRELREEISALKEDIQNLRADLRVHKQATSDIDEIKDQVQINTRAISNLEQARESRQKQTESSREWIYLAITGLSLLTTLTFGIIQFVA